MFDPGWRSLLLAFVPGVVLLARWMLGATSPPLERGIHTAILALALALAGVHAASLLVGSSHLGLMLGLGVLGAAGYTLAAKRPTPAARAPSEPARSERRALWVALGATILLAPAALLYNFHDETLFLGHLSMTASIENGSYPPRHLTFPEHPLRYHYGFDLWAAMLALLFGLRTDLAIDVATLGLAALTVLAASPLLRRLCPGPVPAPLLAVVLFAGGLPFLAPNDAPFCATPAMCEVLSMKWVGGEHLNPPLSSSFFQHPFSLGFPLALLALTVALDLEVRPRGAWRPLVLLALLLAVLSLSQAILFVGLVGAVAGAAAHRRDWPAFGAVLAAVPLAFAFGGFFAFGGGGGRSLVFASGGVAGDLEASLTWHLATFGLSLPLAILGLRRLARGRLLLGLLIAGNLTVLNLVRYEQSWDVVKFATAAHLFLALVSVEALRALWVSPGRLAKTAGALAGATVVGFGVAYAIPFWGFGALPHHPALPGSGRYPGLRAEDQQVLGWLRRAATSSELIYRRFGPARGYAQLGGLPQVWTDIGTEGFGVVGEDRQHRRRAFAGGLQCRLLDEEAVTWVVLDARDPPGDWAVVSEMVEAGLLTRAHEAGDVVVFRRVREGCPPSEPPADPRG